MNRYKLITLAVLFPFISYAQPVINTVAGNGTNGYGADNIQATQSMISSHASKMAIANNGDIYFVDSLRVRMIEAATGVITTIAGSNVSMHGGDNGPATNATFEKPAAIAIATNGDIYVADNWGHRVRKITKTTGIITTVAGTGNSTYNGDNIAAVTAGIEYPYSVMLDKAGNLYIGCASTRSRKVDAVTGIITTFAGNGQTGNAGDGGLATDAEVHSGVMCMDTADNIYIVTIQYGTIRKITASTGIISTIAGTGTLTHSGENVPALNADIPTNYVWDIKTDRYGNIYFPEADDSHRIRRIDATGTISTIAGNGTSGYGGENVVAATTQLGSPGAVGVDSCGNVYVTEGDNHRIRMINIDQCATLSIKGHVASHSLSVYPNPANSELHITSDATIDAVVITDVTGKIVLQRTVNSEQVTVDVSGLSSGVYFVAVRQEKGEMSVVKLVRE